MTGGSLVPGLGVNLPQDVTGPGHGRLVRSFASRAEAAGYDSLWVSESSASDVLDPLASLTYSAAVTERARLGVAVLLTAFRSPLQLSRDIASLDRLSEGRTIVGVGLGNGGSRYAAHGLAVPHRALHFESGLRVLRSLLAEDRTTSHEPWWDLDETPRPLAPVQTPTPPFWFGARAPAALRRTALLGDGWVGAGSSTLEEFTAALSVLRDCLDEAGRADAGFPIAKRVYLHVMEDGEDRTDVVSRSRQWFQHHYGNPSGADRFVVIGSAAQCADHVGRLRQLGTSTIILHPLFEPLAQLDRLTESVAPQLS